jgi:hypothetical protein
MTWSKIKHRDNFAFVAESKVRQYERYILEYKSSRASEGAVCARKQVYVAANGHNFGLSSSLQYSKWDNCLETCIYFLP